MIENEIFDYYRKKEKNKRKYEQMVKRRKKQMTEFKSKKSNK